MADSNISVGGVTRQELIEVLGEALRPIHERLDRLESRMDRLESRMDRLEQEVAGLRQDVGAVSDGLQDLRRDLESHGMLPPAAEAG